MIQQFINREQELKSLNEFNKRREPQLFVIYGRRRVGKTELIKEFIKNKPHIYFLADDRKDKFNIEDLQSKMADFLNDSLFKKAKILDWVELFSEFRRKISKRVILVIDEFPYLIKANKSIPSIFQKIWDELLSDSPIYLILCGSSIAMMEKDVLFYGSPLYGRRTGQWKVEPLSFKEIHKFFPKYNVNELIELYSVLDTIPLYLQKFDTGESVSKNIIKKLLRKGEFLYQEAEILLKEELREPGNYFMILKAVSFGNSKFGDIANYTGLDKTMVSKYLDTLLKLHIITKEFPITSKKERTRETLYRFEDNYFHFWFRFIYPFRSLIEEGKGNLLLKQIRSDFNSHVSFVFENVSKQFLSEKGIFAYQKIGRWWGKGKEIDIVALNEKTKEILFVECKWKDKVNANKIMSNLKEKAKHVKWNNKKRKEIYCIIAKSFKEKIKESDLILFDLEDLGKVFK